MYPDTDNSLENFTDTNLRNPNHLPANIYRLTNTILTTTGSFNDKMDTLTLPTQFNNAFNEWVEKGLISPVKDQMLCGGCWAFASCGSLADRLIIATNGQWYPQYGLSEQSLISCGKETNMQFYNGCAGGIPHFAIDSLSTFGVQMDIKLENTAQIGQGTNNSTSDNGVVNPNISTTCQTGGNYGSTNYTWWQTGCNANNSCSLENIATCSCSAVSPLISANNIVKYKTVGEAHNYSSHGDNGELHTVDLWPDIPQNIIAKNVDRMKKAIYYEGPITVGYRVSADFYTFTPKVDNYYKYCSSGGSCETIGGHAVTIVGWKMIGTVPVWIVKNSWGENWGYPTGPKNDKGEYKYKGGFWNHIMGENDSFIESNASGAHPNILIPPISKFVPSGLPENWFDTMTLRDIYNKTVNNGSPIGTSPIGTSPINLNFKINSITKTQLDDISQIFNNKNVLYLIGSNKSNNNIVSLLTNKKLNKINVNALLLKLKQINDFIIIAAVSTTNNYWFIYGTSDNRTVKAIATLKQLNNEILNQIRLNLNLLENAEYEYLQVI